jgi:predicted Zn-dependent protease
MVLAHELGHFAHRDHLKRLGRGLGLTVAAMLMFGEDSGISRLVSNLFLVTESSYSRQQESDADQFGLDLLVASYGHAGGATDFFARVGKDAGSHIPYLLASHPHPDDRIEELQSLIHEKNYRAEETAPLGDDLLVKIDSEEEAAVQESATTVDK